MKKKNNIIFRGGSGKFGRVFRRIHQNNEILYPASNQLDIKIIKVLKNIYQNLNQNILFILPLYQGQWIFIIKI